MAKNILGIQYIENDTIEGDVLDETDIKKGFDINKYDTYISYLSW